MGKSKGQKKAETTASPKPSPKENAPKSTNTTRRPAPRSTERHQLLVWLVMRGLAAVYLWFYISSLLQIHNKYPLNNLKQAHSNAEALQSRIKQSKPRVTIPTMFGLLDDAGISPVASIYACVVAGAASSLLMLFGVSWTPIVFFLWYMHTSLALVGETVLSTRIDSLLSEAGVLAIIASQMWTFFDNRRIFEATDDGGATASTTATSLSAMSFRWLLFRTLFSAAASKVSVECKNVKQPASQFNLTWWNDCVAHEGLWWAHLVAPKQWQTIAAFLTLIIELWVTFWFYSPKAARGLRIASVYLQILPQIIVLLTGHGDASTVLAIILSMTVLDDDHVSWLAKKKGDDIKQYSNVTKSSKKAMLFNSVVFATLGTMTVFFVTQQFNFKFNGFDAKEPVEITFALSQRYWHSVWLPRMNTVAMAVGIFSFLWPFGQLFLSALMRNSGSDDPALQAAEAAEFWKTSLGIIHLTVSTALTSVMVVLSILNWGQQNTSS